MKINFPKKVNIKNFFIKEGLGFLIKNSKKKFLLNDERRDPNPYKPDLNDLFYLYQLIILNNRTTVLEYGCGWSTLVMHLALMKNKKRKKNKVFKRCGNPFELFSLDDSKKYINIAKKRVKKHSNNYEKVKFNFSKVIMTKFNEKYCTKYLNHPLLNPDFIYIDGPDQWTIKNKIENFTINNYSMMPMISDILKFEHFLTPGTIIVSDGRTANIRFLKSNFQRNWKYYYKKDMDQHYLLLDEKSLGKWNDEQLNYYKK